MAVMNPVLKLFVVFFLGIGVVLAATQCTSDPNNTLEAYYFPIDDLKEGLVYEYQPTDKRQSMDYWYLKTFDMDTAVYLTAQFYNEAFEVRQFSREEIVQNGVMQLDNFIYETDSLGKQTRIDGQILAPAAFPFQAKDSTSVFLMKIKWVYNETPESSLTLIRNRRYLGKTNFSVNEKSYDCIKIGLKELVRSTDNGDLEQEYEGTEIYAKGIGLLYYKKIISDDFIIEYNLKDRYSMDEFQEQFKKSLEVIK